MRILLVTNLYPPQELGGYGRCMSDFCWGLQRLGHHVAVLTSNAAYLGPGSDGPSDEPVQRALHLKGSFENGISQINDLEIEKRDNETEGIEAATAYVPHLAEPGAKPVPGALDQWLDQDSIPC